MALLLISHNLDVMAARVDRLAVMYGGSIVESGPTQAVFERRAHPYTRGLFAARPRLGAPRSLPLATIPGRVPALHEMPAGCAFADRCPLAIDACRTALPPAAAVSGDHRVRCIRWEARVTAALVEAAGLGRQYRLPREHLLPGAGCKRCTISFTLQAGTTLGVVGESGSGKSTLARLVMALEAPSAGQVLFEGRDLNALAPADLRHARRDFQMVFQDPFSSLDPRDVRTPRGAAASSQAVAPNDRTRREALDAVGAPRRLLKSA
jgi:oligopeptide/dipeptide ABC transporter ATP-binding protein